MRGRRSTRRKLYVHDAIRFLGLPCLLDELRLRVWALEHGDDLAAGKLMTSTYAESFRRSVSTAIDGLRIYSYPSPTTTIGVLARAALARTGSPIKVERFLASRQQAVEVWPRGYKRNSSWDFQSRRVIHWDDDKAARAMIRFAFLDFVPAKGERPLFKDIAFVVHTVPLTSSSLVGIISHNAPTRAELDQLAKERQWQLVARSLKTIRALDSTMTADEFVSKFRRKL